MPQPSDNPDDWDAMRERIIGLGEQSIHKSYYPILQQRILDLERFRALIDETNDMILVIRDASSPPVDANRACSSLLGHPMEDLLSRPASSLIPADEQPVFTDIIQRAASSRAQEKIETHLLSALGESLPVELSIRFVTFDDTDYGVIVAHDIRDRRKYERALLQTQKKLNLINLFTRNEIKSQVFVVRAYLDVLRQIAKHPEEASIIEKLNATLTEIQQHITFAENYRDMGAQEPVWQNFNEVLLFALSHLPPIPLSRRTNIRQIEILSDPLLEKGLVHLMDFLYLNGRINDDIVISHEESGPGLLIRIEKDGTGIPKEKKGTIFSWDNPVDKSHSLFFIREVLDITSISIRETGEQGIIRFEIFIPPGAFRLVSPGTPGGT